MPDSFLAVHFKETVNVGIIKLLIAELAINLHATSWGY
jgi:hypothetical protein